MSSDFFQINNLKENDFEFELITEGLETDDIKATFVIESKGVQLGFPCSKNANGKWIAKVPPLPMLERTAYPFHLQIVAEGYHFRPMKGTLNVVGSTELYVQNAKTTIESPIPSEKKQTIKESVKVPKASTTKRHEKSIEQIAKELMESQKNKLVQNVNPTITDIKPANKTPKVSPPADIKPTPFFPNLLVESKVDKKGLKDQEALKILEEAGFKPKIKSKKKFSIKD